MRVARAKLALVAGIHLELAVGVAVVLDDVVPEQSREVTVGTLELHLSQVSILDVAVQTVLLFGRINLL